MMVCVILDSVTVILDYCIPRKAFFFFDQSEGIKLQFLWDAKLTFIIEISLILQMKMLLGLDAWLFNEKSEFSKGIFIFLKIVLS